MAYNALKAVDLFNPIGSLVHGLVPTNKPVNNMDLSVDEKSAVRDAKLFDHIDFVFFRRFSDGRSSQISAYVIENSDERLDKNQLAQLHLQVWLHGAAPLIYVAWPSRIDVLTCARGPDFWENKSNECRYNPAKIFDLEALKTSGTIDRELKKFSAFRLADGTFWEEQSNRELADHSKAAHQSLIQAIVEADDELDGKNNPILRRMLLLMVLIKYLEDRQVFPRPSWFGHFHKGAKSFFDVLKGGEPKEVYRLLDFLEGKFNGDVFSLPRKGLTKELLKTFAYLVEAKTLDRQRYLWEQFSFEHLPVEVISHLYQRFVEGGHGTVYTPPFLSSLLLDHSMPYSVLTGNECILDPACGSGVFLVGAFRRLINVWRSNNNWQRPDVNTLKQILKRSIYGIELDPNAIDLTSFSLSLAICDALLPDVIWRELKFDPLRNTNLYQGDFFSFLADSCEGKSTALDNEYDVVIGNPPFESELTVFGQKVDLAAQQDDSRKSLPDNQVAHLFLEQAFKVLRPGGRVCLIQPSGLLYNLNTRNFMETILRNYEIDAVFDFTSIRKLYDEADPKTIAVLARNNKPAENNVIDHHTFRRTVSVRERICFELDHYDRHRIPQRHLEHNSFVWRANLLGGGRLVDISKRLQSMRTLNDYIVEKDWEYGEGFVAAIRGKRDVAKWLTGKPFLPTAAFTDEGIDKSKIDIVKDKRFRSAYSEKRFSSPLVLIKENASLPVVFWDNGFLAYRAQVVGIHSPQSQKTELLELYNNILAHHDLLQFSCVLNGTRSLVGKATAILKQDIDVLPYPKDLSEFQLSFWENALCYDVLYFMMKYVRLGQNSDVLKTAAGPDEVEAYADMFIQMLGSVYENLHSADPVFLNGLICQPFYFGDRPKLNCINIDAEEELKALVYNYEHHKNLRTVRLLRIYSENVFIIIKPDRLRYWIRSTAIRDADETIFDLRQQGY